MLQVGASITEAARSFASWARILKPACSMSEVSHVAPKAVPDCLRIRSCRRFEWCFVYWQTLCRRPHKDVFSSYTIRTIADLELRVMYRSCKIWRTDTLKAGIPRRSTECVCHHSTPAVRRIASSIVKSFKTLSMSAVAKSEGGIYAGVYWSSKPSTSVQVTSFVSKPISVNCTVQPSISVRHASWSSARFKPFNFKDPGTNGSDNIMAHC